MLTAPPQRSSCDRTSADRRTLVYSVGEQLPVFVGEWEEAVTTAMLLRLVVSLQVAAFHHGH